MAILLMGDVTGDSSSDEELEDVKIKEDDLVREKN